MKKRTIIFFVLIAILFFVTNYIEDYKEFIVYDIVDGDTIKISDGSIIRLTGINAPEKGEPCYEEAKEKLKELVYRKSIRLEKDTENRDVYGRLLRYVYVKEMFINSEMVRLGLARSEEVGQNKKYSELFLELESKARDAGRCIWL